MSLLGSKKYDPLNSFEIGLVKKVRCGISTSFCEGP